MCPHTTICVLILPHVSSYYYIHVRILLYTCPHTTTCVLMLLYMCILQEQAAAARCVGGVSEGASERGRSNREPKSEVRVSSQTASGEDRAERVIRLAMCGRFS